MEKNMLIVQSNGDWKTLILPVSFIAWISLASALKVGNSSLLELFLEGPGRVVRVAVGESRGEDCWSRALPPITNMVAQVWTDPRPR